jgi:thiol-disulfide isomerase/thioredoxin
MQTIAIIIAVVVLIFGVGYLATNSSNDATSTPQAKTESSVEVTLETEDASTQETESSSTEDSAGRYVSYDAEEVAQSDAEHILLFFHATWCPSCRALDADITANTESIPDGVEIYKVDYDTQTALKQQYGVTTQHSVIEIDSTGVAQSAITHPLTFEKVISTL